jgi:hypothetical protein
MSLAKPGCNLSLHSGFAGMRYSLSIASNRPVAFIDCCCLRTGMTRPLFSQWDLCRLLCSRDLVSSWSAFCLTDLVLAQHKRIPINTHLAVTGRHLEEGLIKASAHYIFNALNEFSKLGQRNAFSFDFHVRRVG